MATAEPLTGVGVEQARTGPKVDLHRRWAWSGLAVVLGGGLALRLWGVAQGLPYAFNADEADHFVPKAIAMFAHGLNPRYFANPPAFTYVLHLVFAAWFGGGAGARRAFALHPDEVYTLARVIAALLGTAALWLLYATGARLFNRGVGLLAAAIEAVAFLPVFYAHLALNDAPTLAPVTLSLLGSAGVVRKGRLRDYLLAGIGLGLACASKYTAGIVVLPLLAAAVTRYLTVPPGSRAYVVGRRAATGVVLAGAGALLAFLLANPYAVLDFQSFHSGLVHQSTLSAEAQGKLGAPKEGGVLYYLWSLTWGLGWLPALAALGGGAAVWRKDRQADLRSVGWLLVPAPLLFLAFMGLQGRYFGRWLLPIFPILCLLAAFFALLLAGAIAPRKLKVCLTALLVVLLLGQGILYSVHAGLVLSRADTRNLTRAWMVANVPKGSPIVAEPVSPDEWAREAKRGTSTATNPYRWPKYPSLLSRIATDGSLEPSSEHRVGIENYERTLSPALIGYYERHSYCWVVSGSTQSGRALVDPKAVPQALAYYAALAREGEVVDRASPYSHGRGGRGSVPFDFDWSFDYYPFAYDRPGPEMTVYRLRGGGCRSRS